jgi:ribonuclease R
LSAGAIELSLPEIKIILDDDGRVAGARVAVNTVSHQIIEEFMLAANQAVAETLTERGLLFLRRIHEPPSPVKLKSLTQFVRELGIRCDSLESRFEIKRVISAVHGEATEHAVNYAVLRSMQKAVYGPKESGHYALNWDQYCHFTSPIRRYPDLDIHRMFAAIEDHKRPRSHRGELRALGEHCSEREQRAEAAERELVKLKLLNYLNDRLGLQMQAVITGVEEFGLFAEGVELPAEGFIAVSSLQDDYYHYDATSHSLIGHRAGNQFRLGDKLVVEVVHVDLARRELDFRLVAHTSANHRPRRSPMKVAKAAGRSTSKAKRLPRNKPKKRRRR